MGTQKRKVLELKRSNCVSAKQKTRNSTTPTRKSTNKTTKDKIKTIVKGKAKEKKVKEITGKDTKRKRKPTVSKNEATLSAADFNSSEDYFVEQPIEVTKKRTKKEVKSNNDIEIEAGYLEKKTFEHAYEDPNWEGNEDDQGSVASGVLEEDFCHACGLSTLSSHSWNNVILCDVCDAEYHLSCLKLNKIPRSTFVCGKCINETEAMKNLRFNVSDVFRIPKRKVYDRRVIYTPSRPLEPAFRECNDKGLMVVSEVFPYDVMRVLTHGTLESTTKSGRVADIWHGATVEVPRRLSAGTLTDMVDRDGRFDLKLPDFVVSVLRLNELLAPILTKLRTIMGSEPQLRTHNVVFAPVGSKAQQWHTDDHAMKQRKPYRYFTILIHLNSLDSNCGGTEVWSDKLNRGDLIRARPGDALVFSGSLLHRGLGNHGYTHRFFYYASFACGVDMNVAMI